MGAADVLTGGAGVTLGEVRVAAGFDVGPCAVTAAELLDTAVPVLGPAVLCGGAASATPPNTTTRATEAAGWISLENRTTSVRTLVGVLSHEAALMASFFQRADGGRSSYPGAASRLSGTSL